MPAMSRLEAALCRSAPWQAVAGRFVLPWALRGATLKGDILEVGGGDGTMAAALLESSPEARVTLTDFDPVMIERAGARLHRFGARAEIAHADVTALPFADASFDAALSFIMLHHVGRWEDALPELVRVLRPGGRLFVYDLLDSAVTRLVHAITKSGGVRLIRRKELVGLLGTLDLEAVAIDGQRLIFRLHARRPAHAGAGKG